MAIGGSAQWRQAASECWATPARREVLFFMLHCPAVIVAEGGEGASPPVTSAPATAPAITAAWVDTGLGVCQLAP